MRKKIPKLVVVTAFPTSGKTILTKFLGQELDFVRLSGDDISIELFGHTYPYKENENSERIWETIYQRRDELLKQGKNLVIDTTAYNEEKRKKLFNTSVHVEKYLIWLKVDSEIMNKRTKKRKWTKESIKRWKGRHKREDPKKGSGYKFLVYQNNKPKDLEKIKTDLKKQLK